MDSVVLVDSLFSEFELQFGYSFQNQKLLEKALTHKSFGYEERDQQGVYWVDNERLEFLGDAVLELIISEYLMEKGPEKSEGELSRLRAAMVNEGRLAEIAVKVGIPAALRLGRGEERSQGRDKPSILADAYEALVAAIYYDRGLEEAKRVVRGHFHTYIDEMMEIDKSFDYKTRFQEICQKKLKVLPFYRVVKEDGPDHQKSFEVELFLAGKSLAFGIGKSKKEAEQVAASVAIKGFEDGV